MYHYAMDLYPRGSDDEEEQRARDLQFEAIETSVIDSQGLLHHIGFTEAMEKEAFQQILSAELADYPKNVFPEWADRTHHIQHKYHSCMQFAYRYMQEFKNAYLEYAASLALCEEDRIAERLEQS